MTSQRTSIPVSELIETIKRGIEGTDLLRAEHLERLLAFRTLKEKSLKREGERLANKLSPDDERIALIEKRKESNAHLVRGLSREGLRSRTEVPTVDKATWVLHGYVRDPQGHPLPNLTVALYDREGKLVRDLGYGCTDERGHFKITYTRPRTEETTGSAARQSPEVFIRVFDRKGTCLYVDKDALTPELGTVDYREIIISDEGEACKPPEDVVPGLGLSPLQPGKKKKTKIEDIKGVGHVLAKKLREAGIRDLKTFAETDDARLKEVLGKRVNVVEMKRQAASFLKETD